MPHSLQNVFNSQNEAKGNIVSLVDPFLQLRNLGSPFSQTLGGTQVKPGHIAWTRASPPRLRTPQLPVKATPFLESLARGPQELPFLFLSMVIAAFTSYSHCWFKCGWARTCRSRRFYQWQLEVILKFGLRPSLAMTLPLGQWNVTRNW